MKRDRDNVKLRDHLLSALSHVPGTRELHLHTLVSGPRKSNALFPFAKPKPPRVYVQDVLVILSECVQEKDKEKGKEREKGKEEEDKGGPSRVIISAIEATIYQIASTSSCVLYVSKVDSTGHAYPSFPSPTSTLVQSFIQYYLDPHTRPAEIQGQHMWVQLFARAHGQYLFPGSSEWAGKRPLSDVKLCGWWKRVLGRVVGELERCGKEREEMKMKMYYILPGYSKEEAENTLRVGDSTRTSVEWEYGHPYSQTEIPLPCPKEEEGVKNLGHWIPSFEDDPKSRFMDEIAYTTGEIKSPVRKRARTMTDKERGSEREAEEDKALGELGKVSADEFWERMSFRQECVAGAVTGFFSVMLMASSGGVEEWRLAPQAGQVSGQIIKRVMTTLQTGVDFSTTEKAVKATETVEGAIRGLCDGLVPAKVRRARTPERRTGVRQGEPKTPTRQGRGEIESPNGFGEEPVASVETYRDYIYGVVATRNAVVSVERGGPAPVRVLSVRKKRAVFT